MHCEICKSRMTLYPAELAYYSQGKKVSIKNYPFYLCPVCANIKSQKRDLKKLTQFLKKQGEKVAFVQDLEGPKKV